MSASRRRLDAEVVRRGLLPDLGAASAAIAEGRVTVDGAPATKAGRLVAPGEAVHVADPPPRYVGRAGEKLHAALATFGIEPAGRRALDVGASTGGFTDCLLQHGAAHVVALDVGRGQIHERLRADPRVEVRERTDVRRVEPTSIAPPPSLVTIDVSFVPLRRVLPAVLALAGPGADLVVLVKPQFEAPRELVTLGRGVVRDPGAWRDALQGAAGALDDLGAAIMGAMVSPLRGADGNVEFLLHARAPAGAGVEEEGIPLDLDALVAAAATGTSGP